MALQAAYKQFLDAPKADLLAENASLHYITTLTTHKGSNEIIKHLKAQAVQIKKKSERFLDVIESHNAVVVDVETTMEFVISGGAYLPGLDDNFLADRTVTLPIIHIVSFNSNNKIVQIRQNWDQGSLLKLIDVIGKTGRNWPIRDGRDQINLIVNSVKSSGNSVGSAAPLTQGNEFRSRKDSTNVTRDPHASLAIFAPRDTTVPESRPSEIEQAKSAKPAPRDYHELFVGQDEEHNSVLAGRNGQSSPERAIAPKGGQNKNYQPSRLFDSEHDYVPSPAKQEAKYRPDPKRYQHFDFTDESHDAPAQKVKSNHKSNWEFDHFQTPDKIVPTKTLHGQNAQNDNNRQWGSDETPAATPLRPKFETKPRKDADKHFEFNDEASPAVQRRIIGRPRGPGQDSGMGLYRGHNVYDDDEVVQPIDKPIKSKALGNITNQSNRNEPHFSFEDNPPIGHQKQPSVSEAQAKLHKSLESHWDNYDESPLPNQKENFGTIASPTNSRPSTAKGILSERDTIQHKGITIAGDGMGSRKGTEAGVIKPRGIKTGGDGMGGAKGVGRSWGFGDDSDGEETGGLNAAGGKFSRGVPGKAQHKAQNSTGSGDFWDY